MTRIDAFAHVLTPRYATRVFEVLGEAGDPVMTAEVETMLSGDPTLSQLDARFALMDEIGPDYRQVLVMGQTSTEDSEQDIAAELVETANAELAEFVRDHPDRFAGWVAQVALHDGDRALASVERAIADGALGVQVFTMTQGRPLDDPAFEPFFAVMADLDRPIWLHPNRTIDYSDYPFSEPRSRYSLHSRAQWPADTTIALARIVYAGYLERWPELKVIAHHGGGTLPVVAGRLGSPKPIRGDDGKKVAALLKHPPLEYFKRYYADTATFGNPILLRAALEFFGADRVLFGTDFGYSQTHAKYAIEDIEAVVLDEAWRHAIYAGNAARLLRLPESAADAP